MIERMWKLLLAAGARNRFPPSPSPFAARRAVRSVGFLGLGAVVVVAAVTAVRTSPAYRAIQIERENTLLVAELQEMRERVAGLQEVVDELTSKDAEIRALAGLDPVDEDVLMAGIGGPGGHTLASHPLNELGEEPGAEAFAAAWDLQALERRAGILRESLSEAADRLAVERDRVDSTPSILPVRGAITSRFSSTRFHPIHNRIAAHEGIDVSAPTGTPIVAAARGRVVSAGRQAGYGLRVEIDHGYGVQTLYAHASRVLVRPGQIVERGEVVAQVGSTGLATSPHLHYEVRVNRRPVDPMNYIFPGALP